MKNRVSTSSRIVVENNMITQENFVSGMKNYPVSTTSTGNNMVLSAGKKKRVNVMRMKLLIIMLLMLVYSVIVIRLNRTNYTVDNRTMDSANQTLRFSTPSKDLVVTVANTTSSTVVRTDRSTPESGNPITITRKNTNQALRFADTVVKTDRSTYELGKTITITRMEANGATFSHSDQIWIVPSNHVRSNVESYYHQTIGLENITQIPVPRHIGAYKVVIADPVHKLIYGESQLFHVTPIPSHHSTTSVETDRSTYEIGTPMYISWNNTKGNGFNDKDQLVIVPFNTTSNYQMISTRYNLLKISIRGKSRIKTMVRMTGKFKVVLIAEGEHYDEIVLSTSKIFQVKPTKSTIVTMDRNSYEIGSVMFISWMKTNGETFDDNDQIMIVPGSITKDYDSNIRYFTQTVAGRSSIGIHVNWLIGQFKVVLLASTTAIVLATSDLFNVTKCTTVIQMDHQTYRQGSLIHMTLNKTNGDSFHYYDHFFDRIRIVSVSSNTTKDFIDSIDHSDILASRNGIDTEANWDIGTYKAIILVDGSSYLCGESNHFQITKDSYLAELKTIVQKLFYP
jgi:hypothetical protein